MAIEAELIRGLVEQKPGFVGIELNPVETSDFEIRQQEIYGSEVPFPTNNFDLATAQGSLISRVVEGFRRHKRARQLGIGLTVAGFTSVTTMVAMDSESAVYADRRPCVAGEIPNHDLDEIYTDQFGVQQIRYWCGTAGGTTTTPPTTTTPAPPKGSPPIAPNKEITVGVPSGMVMVGNLTSIGESKKPDSGWTAIFKTDGGYQGNSTTNMNGFGDIATNTFVTGTGSGGISFKSSIATHEVVDTGMYIPNTGNKIQLYDSPKRLFDSRAFKPLIPAKEVTVIQIEPGHEDDVAILNLTLESNYAGWGAIYPCESEYKGTSDLNTTPKGSDPAKAGMVLVKLGESSKVCVMGNQPMEGVILDGLGFIEDPNDNFHEPVRIDDQGTRSEYLLPQSEYIIHTGEPDSVYIGPLTVRPAGDAGSGWCAVYPRSGGYNGTSLINPDGIYDAFGLMWTMTDELGDIAVRCSRAAQIVIGEVAIVPASEWGLNSMPPQKPSRIFDSRN